MTVVCIGHENFQKWPVAAQALIRNESAFSAFLKDFRVQETQGNTTSLVGRCGQIKDAGYEIFKGLFHTDRPKERDRQYEIAVADEMVAAYATP